MGGTVVYLCISWARFCHLLKRHRKCFHFFVEMMKREGIVHN